MHLRRIAKSLAFSAALSRLGSSSLVSRVVMNGVRLDYEPPGGTALSCVSIDFDVTDSSRFEANREGTHAILELAEKHEIPITWAICGQAAERDLKSYNAILNSTQDHEIGIHTYSHMDASASAREDFRADITRCMTVLGLESPRSFVFPWNREGHFEVLRELGFRAFRGPRRAIGPPLAQEGLWNVRPLYYLDQKSIGAEELIGKYLELCVRRGGVFHIWSHPWCIPSNGDNSPMARTLDRVFQMMDDLRQESKLVVSTMGGISYLMESTSQQTIPLAVP